ncbi:MAG: hypothetical protein R3192_15355 [Woeseiaceae bacterium]|nr:hypothetical protein [Woeseiaceae bacterium]
MIKARCIMLMLAGAMMSGCSSAPTCDELAFYEHAEGGRRIEPPEDLDPLDAGKEMVIPEASPRPPRDLDAGCIDRPPRLQDLAGGE